MNTASDASEQIVRFYLEGVEVAFKIAGEGAKHLAVIIYQLLKDNKQTKGKTRLTNMLKMQKELKIYSFKSSDLKKFSEEAKKYGVLYCVLADKKNQKIDGIVDVMIREEDAVKVNRIAERFKFAEVDRASLSKELEELESNEKIVEEKTKEELIAEDVFSIPSEQELQQDNSPSNENTEEKSLLEISSDIKEKDNLEINFSETRKSVKKELKEIEKEIEMKKNEKSIDKEDFVIQKTNSKKIKSLNKKKKREPKHLKVPKHLDNTRKRKKSKMKERI